MLAQVLVLLRRGSSGRLGGLVWTHALLGGMVAWMLALIARTSLVTIACQEGALGALTLYGVSLVGALISVHAIWTARTLRRRSEEEADDVRTAGVFLASVGVWVNVLAVVLIVSETVPVVFLDPCAGP